MSYELISSPEMPISVSALRDHCRIIGDDFDTQLTRSWYASAYDIERRSGILLRPCSVVESLRGLGALRGFVLSVGPVDVSTVLIKDSDGNELTGWYVDPNVAEPTICFDDTGSFERGADYSITYNAGYSMIPHDLMIAALELTAHHFENREATSAVSLKAVPSSVWSILENYGRAKV